MNAETTVNDKTFVWVILWEKYSDPCFETELVDYGVQAVFLHEEPARKEWKRLCGDKTGTDYNLERCLLTRGHDIGNDSEKD